MLRASVKGGLARAAHWSGATRALALAGGGATAPLVVGYHRVVEDFPAAARTAIPSLLISTRMLDAHLEWLQRYRRIVPLDELVSRIETRAPGSHRLAAVTFDDGYEDVFTHALPLLARRGIPAAVFVASGWIEAGPGLLHDRLFALASAVYPTTRARGSEWRLLLRRCGLPAPEPFTAAADAHAVTRRLLEALPRADLLGSVEKLEALRGDSGSAPARPLGWGMLQTMQQAGITIGSHTRTHALLPREDPRTQEDELAGSRRDLEVRLGVRIDHVAYPDGQFDATTCAIAARAGYRAGFTICRHRDPRHPSLTVPRRILWEKSCADSGGSFSPVLMEAVISGLFDPAAPCRLDHGPRARARVAS